VILGVELGVPSSELRNGTILFHYQRIGKEHFVVPDRNISLELDEERAQHEFSKCARNLDFWLAIVRE